MWTKDNLNEIVKTSTCKSDVLKKLNLRPFTGNYDTLKRYIKIYNIDISHFKRAIFVGHNFTNKIPLVDILIKDSKYTNRVALKERLYKEGVKKRECELCGQGEEWQGKHMSLILDHINGVNDDNRPENLRIVCPNCNGTLDTHCGKNTKDKRVKKIRPPKEIYRCKSCDKPLTMKSNLCLGCYNIQQRHNERPSYEQLSEDVRLLGFVNTGKKYNVTDNSIRKWIKFYKMHP